MKNVKSYPNTSLKLALGSIIALSTASFLVQPALAQSTSPATLYQHCNYGGYAVKLGPGGSNYYDLIRGGAKNDDVSSIKLAPGYKIEIFRDANYQGPSKTFDKDVSCLVRHKMNDYLSSVKVSKISEAAPVTPIGHTTEQKCFDMVQGKVAWNREGNKQWDPKNIINLCERTTNPKQTITCFEGSISHRNTLKATIDDCKSGATHSFLSGVKHTDGSLMTSHFINGRNVSAAYFKQGRFEEVKDNSKSWKEYDKKGEAIFTFSETGRDEWSVYMTDKSRNIKLQIDVHRKMVRVDMGSGMYDLYQVEHFAEFHK